MIDPTVNDDGLKNSIAFSAMLHGAFMLFLYFGLPHLFKPLPSHHDPVPFEIVELADITNTRVKEEPQEQQKPPAPPPKPAPKPVEQSQPQATPTPPVPNAESLSKPKPQEKPKPPEVKPKTDALASVLRNVEKMKQQAQPSPTPTKTETKTKEQEAKSLAPTLSNRLTITEEDLLRRQIQQCWNMPVGARNAQDLIVEVIIAVNPDRTVQRADIVDKSRMASDPFFRAAAESAVRALYNPRCSPLELPADKYEQWKTIDFTFDPRDML